MGKEDISEIKKRIALAKDKENQNITEQKKKLEVEQQEREERGKEIEKQIRKDIRWQEMARVANNPLLKAVLEEYFKEIEKTSFRLSIGEKVGHSDYENIQKAADNRWIHGEPEIKINGISIKWNNRTNKLKIEVYVEESSHEDYPDYYHECEGIDELIDYIVICIAKKQKIKGLAPTYHY